MQRYATDRFLQINALIVAVLFVLGVADLVGMDSAIGRAAHAVHELFGVMWWGILIAIFVIGVLDKLPQELIIALMGKPGSRSGIYRSAIADNNSFEQWELEGAKDANQRANAVCKTMLADYEAPALDPAHDEALLAYIARRKDSFADSNV